MLLRPLLRNHIVLRKKTKSYNKKAPNGLDKLHLDFSEERKEETSAEHVGVFSQNLRIKAYTLEDILILKINFYLTMALLLE